MEFVKKGGVLCFFFLSFAAHVGGIRDRVSQGVTIPVLSNVDIDYSGTTIKKKKGTLDARRMKLETRRVGRNERRLGKKKRGRDP